jgi:ribonuclease HII
VRETDAIPLAELRLRLGAERGARRRRLLAALFADRRAGARRLAEACARRERERAAEARRLGRLLARRRALFAAGARIVAGVDEVGVGPLAGPVVAAAVVLPERVDLPGLDDSKRLAPAARERLARAIRAQAVALAIAEVSAQEVDARDVLRAAQEAMRRAIAALPALPDHALVDGRPVPRLGCAQTALVGGDARDASIAAASIVAKVHRDARMRELDTLHPGYGFAIHAGYATAAHLAALRRLGPSPIHRRSFAPVAALLAGPRRAGAPVELGRAASRGRAKIIG